jgi:pimeloyl-ACP methyl ester carboxylesterase
LIRFIMKDDSPKMAPALRGLAQLLKDAGLSITDIAEELNHRIAEPLGLPATPVQRGVTRISGWAYSGVRKLTSLIGDGVEFSLRRVNPAWEAGLDPRKKSVLISVLNGIIGDYLARKNNVLAIRMAFRYQGNALELEPDAITQSYEQAGAAAPNGRILLVIHGLCMNDLQWQRKDCNYGLQLAESAGFTPVFLHYNSGLHISQNGRQLARNLDELIEAWPVPVEQLVILGHSMGGLLARSAHHYAKAEGSRWPDLLRKMMFLGTPHHGAPLERVGNYVDRMLDATPFSRPFSRIGKIRSPGITDLRYGNLVDEDWNTADRFVKREDERRHLPLPLPATGTQLSRSVSPKLSCYAVAAILGKPGLGLKANVVGDGLVPPKSALGQHKDPARNLYFQARHQLTVYETSHWDLLSDSAVYTQLEAWMSS